MRGVKPMKLSFVTRPFTWGRAHHLGVGVLAYFPLQAESTLLTEMELWTEGMEILGDVAPDLGIPKSRAEFLVMGNVYQPKGEPGPLRHVRARVGDLEKSLYVVGDRRWVKGVPTEPAPFTSMPLSWSRAFGGEGYDMNPHGKGFAQETDAEGRPFRPLPNIELPGRMLASERDRPEPAGFGPIDFTWPQRFSMAGTYDQRWLETRFPGFAEDLDWRIWNLAPPDQQRDEPFVGDEEYVLEHLHPELPEVRGRLPGMRAVCFVDQRTPSGSVFAEVPLKLTTIWFFPEILRGIAIYHGAHPVLEDDADDVEAILVAAERLEAPPRGEAHYRDVFARRTGEDRGTEILVETDLLPDDLGAVGPIDQQAEKTTHEGLRGKRQRKRMEANIAAARAELVERGLDPDEHGPSELEPEPELPTFEELGKYTKEMLAKGESMKADAEVRDAAALEKLKAFCEETGTDYDEIVEEMRSTPRGPPEFTADGQRAKMRALSDELTAAGNPVEELEYWASAEEPYAEWQRAEKQSKDAYRMSAHLQSPALLAPEEVSAGRRQLVEGALERGESFADWDLTGIDLSGLVLAGADLERAFLESANLSGATLDRANLRGAVLAHANLSGASLEAADLQGANVGGARLDEARLVRANLTEATLTKASFVAATLDEAKLDGASLDECILEGASFERASLASVFFHELELGESTRFGGADLSWATFAQCVVSGVDFSGCRLEDATFFDTRAEGARFVNAFASKLRVVGEVSLREADFRGAKLDQATMRGVCLAGADFSGANLDRADLSKADLQGAKFYRVVARNVALVRADLRGAMMVSADLFEAVLEKADLRGVDLRGANLYAADFALVRSDERTTVADAIQDRVRTLPRREST